MMQKRRIAVAIAGLFIGGAGLAAVEQDMLPGAATGQATLEPAQVESAQAEATQVESMQTEAVPAESTQGDGVSIKSVQRYLGSLVATIGKHAVRGDTFPPSADDMVWQPLPVQAKYLEDRAAQIQVATGGNAFPPSAEDLASKPLPALAGYLDGKAPNVNVAGIDSSASGTTE